MTTGNFHLLDFCDEVLCAFHCVRRLTKRGEQFTKNRAVLCVAVPIFDTIGLTGSFPTLSVSLPSPTKRMTSSQLLKPIFDVGNDRNSPFECLAHEAVVSTVLQLIRTPTHWTWASYWSSEPSLISIDNHGHSPSKSIDLPFAILNEKLNFVYVVWD